MLASRRTSSIQLALSQREKIRRLIQKCSEARATAVIDQARHDSLRRYYDGRLRRAEEVLDGLRKQERQRSARLEQAIAETRSQQVRLAEQVSLGKLTPRRANARNRRLARTMARLEAELTASRAMAAAESVDLPLEGYAKGLARRLVPVAILLVVVVCVGTAAGLLAPVVLRGAASSGVVFDCGTAAGHPDLVLVQCYNRTDAPASVVVPWPAGGRAQGSSGIALYIFERGQTEYRLFPAAEDCWRCDGLPVRDAIQVEFGVAKVLALDLSRLKTSLPAATAIRLAFLGPDGTTLNTFETELPGRLTLRARPATRVEPEPVPAAPSGEPAKAEPAPSPPQEPKAAVTVRFTGIVGGKVALRITTPEKGVPESRLVKLGEEIAPGWFLDATQPASSGIVVRHAESNRIIAIHPGSEPVALRPEDAADGLLVDGLTGSRRHSESP